jgi:hypothetical protein
MICNVHLSRQAPDIHEGKLALTQKRARVFSRSGLIVSEVPRELGHRSSDVLMASVGLEVSATVRGCAAAIVIASEGYAISQNAAVLDTGTNAVGNAALSRFELAELEKQEVSLVAVVPSDALAATLVDRSTGGDSGAAGGAGPPLPMHLGGLLAGAVCVRYGDPRRATAQLEEVLRALEGVGVQMPDKTTTAAADGLRDHDDDDDDDEVSQSAQVASPTSAAASSGHTATTAGVGDATAEGQADAAAVAAKRLALHAKAVAAAEKALDEATAAQAQAQAAVDTAKKKKDKKAAEDVLSEKTAVVEETKAALAKVQADEPSKQTTTEDATASGSGSGSGPGSGSAPNRGDGSQTKQKKKTTSTTNETESLAAASAPSAGGKSTPEKRAGRVRSERASSVAAGQRVAALTADVRFAPSQFEMSRAAEMRQQDAVDDDALRECAILVLPPAR